MDGSGGTVMVSTSLSDIRRTAGNLHAHQVDEEADVPVREGGDDRFLLERVDALGRVWPTCNAQLLYDDVACSFQCKDVPGALCHAITNACLFSSSQASASAFQRGFSSKASRIYETQFEMTLSGMVKTLGDSWLAHLSVRDVHVRCAFAATCNATSVALMLNTTYWPSMHHLRMLEVSGSPLVGERVPVYAVCLRCYWKASEYSVTGAPSCTPSGAAAASAFVILPYQSTTVPNTSKI